MITIKHRYSGEALCEFDVETVKQATEKGKANLREADLRGADLYGADLYGADLRRADLYGADLRRANLRGADLRRANLYGADLYGADLRGADLYGADLREADLDGADLREADLCRANLREADLDGEKITKTPVIINGINYWCLITEGYMRLGCQRHTHNEWREFTDAQILEMDGENAIIFWHQWKAPLLAMCRAHKGE